MKKIIRLTESDLHDIIKKSVNKIIKEDVLGDNWHEIEQDDNVYNNYEPFEAQMDDRDNEHDWSGVGEEEFDPTYYDETHNEPLGWNDDEAEGYEEDMI